MQIKKNVEVNKKTCTVVLLSDLKNEKQKDYLEKMKPSIRSQYLNGEIDLIVGFYNEHYDYAVY